MPHVQLSWEYDETPETGFKIIRRTEGRGDYEVVAELPGTDRAFADTRVVAGKQYDYLIFAVNPGGKSVPANLSITVGEYPKLDVPRAFSSKVSR